MAASLPDLIQQESKRRGMSLEQLSKLTAVSWPTFHTLATRGLQKGTRKNTIVEVAKLLNMRPGDLLNTLEDCQ